MTFEATGVDPSFEFGPANASVGAGPEFTYNPASTSREIVVDFGAENLDLIFSMTGGNSTIIAIIPPLTTLAFLDQMR